MTTPLIADDQGMVRAGFRSLLESEPALEVVGEAENGEVAVNVVRRLRPDVTLMDIRMPVLDGIAATRRLVGEGVPTRLKDAPAEEPAAAIRAVASGDALLAPGVTRRVIDGFVRRSSSQPARRSERLSTLTPRELEVLGLLARGLSNLDISAKLSVSELTGRRPGRSRCECAAGS